MSNHFENLKFYLPKLAEYSILDIGSGRGRFLVDAASAGAKVLGIETYYPYVELTYERAKIAQVNVSVLNGKGEHTSCTSEMFDFVNLSEVIEHVDEPSKVMAEAYRVLKSGGYAYVSVPNRFAIYDSHFHLWFINWLPRSIAEKYISMRGKHKDYSIGNGQQRISKMYYNTYNGAHNFFHRFGFVVLDMRILKIKKMGVVQLLLLPVYILLRFFYFNAHHFLLKKPNK